MAIIPHLLNNCETWTELDQDCIDELDKLQTLFLSVLMAVPSTCARPDLPWDTQSLSMTNRIIQRKLNLCVHLKKLDGKDLSKQIFEEQLRNGYPGLNNCVDPSISLTSQKTKRTNQARPSGRQKFKKSSGDTKWSGTQGKYLKV